MSGSSLPWFRPKSQVTKAALVCVGLVVLLSLAGCGGGGVALAPPPTSGGYSNASLQGSYAFAFSGNNNFGFFSMAGSLTADGKGNISSGSLDVSSGSGVFPNLAISGTYSIGADGRGIATLQSSLNPITIAFVMLSSQRALVVRFDTFATASGTMDLQNTSAFSTAALQGGFAFDVGGVDNVGNSFGSAGNFQADNAGNLASGVEDFNDGGAVTVSQALTGSWSVGPANGRGTVTLTTSLGNLQFAFYVVDANHLKLVEIDAAATLAGDAFRQQGTFSNASLNGAFPFTVGGLSNKGAFAAGGIFNADGNGTISGGVEDVNNGGAVTLNLVLSGNYSVAATGRGTMSLTNPTGTSTFVVYPTSGGVLLLETDAIIVAGGTALQQTGGPFSNATVQGNYGLNLSGSQAGFEIDTASQFNAGGSGHLSGSMDINNGGALFQGVALSGNYLVSGTGRGTMVLQNSTANLNLVFYVVSPSRALFLETDASLPALGEFDSQQ